MGSRGMGQRMGPLKYCGKIQKRSENARLAKIPKRSLGLAEEQQPSGWHHKWQNVWIFTLAQCYSIRNCVARKEPPPTTCLLLDNF